MLQTKLLKLNSKLSTKSFDVSQKYFHLVTNQTCETCSANMSEVLVKAKVTGLVFIICHLHDICKYIYGTCKHMSIFISHAFFNSRGGWEGNVLSSKETLILIPPKFSKFFPPQNWGSWNFAWKYKHYFKKSFMWSSWKIYVSRTGWKRNECFEWFPEFASVKRIKHQVHFISHVNLSAGVYVLLMLFDVWF